MIVRRNFWIAFVLFILNISLNAIFHQIFLQRLAILLGLIMLVGFIWAELSLQGVRFFRTSKHLRYNCGEVFEENYIIRNDSRFRKLWLSVLDKSNFAAKPASRSITLIKGKTSLFFQSLFVLASRGEYQLGPSLLQSGDPFGFFSKQYMVEPVDSVLVLPYSVPMEVEWNPKGDLSGGKAHREYKSLASMNATTVREYKPGDALKKIHWKTSIRTQKWMVKEFEQDPLANIWIVLDGDSTYYISGNNELRSELLLPSDAYRYEPQFFLPKDNFEYAVCTAATLIDYFDRMGRGVGLLFEGNRKFKIVPEKGNRQKSKLLEALAFINPITDVPLASVLKSQSSRISKGNSTIVISSNRNDELIGTMNSLKRKGIDTHFIFIDPKSFSGKVDDLPNSTIFSETGIPTLIIRYEEDISKILSGYLMEG